MFHFSYDPLTLSPPIMSRWLRERHELRHGMGQLGRVVSPSTVARVFGVSPDVVKYCMRKSADPTLHAGSYGGARRWLLTRSAQTIVEFHAWQILKFDPK